VVGGSDVVSFLVSVFGCVQAVLPEVLRQAAVLVQYFLI